MTKSALWNYPALRYAVRWIDTIRREEYEEEISFIPVSLEIAEITSEYAFALKIKDDSMHPDLKINDLVIVNPDDTPQPGNLVAARIEEGEGVVIRSYKQLSVLKEFQEYELLAINPAWASIRINSDKSKII